MDEQLRHIIQHLYGEDPPVPVEELLRDDDLRAEYEALRDVKQRLDQRPPVHPPSEVVNRVLAAAAEASSSPLDTTSDAPRERTDRAPRPHAASRRRTWQALAVTLVVIIGVGIVFTQIEGTMMPSTADEMASPAVVDDARQAENRAAMKAEQASPGAPAGAESFVVADSAAPAEAEPAEPAAADDSPFKARVGLAASQSTPDTPTWDESEAVQQLHRRIELLEARSTETAWDDPAVMSLDVLPGRSAPSRLDRGLNTVREQRSRSGGQ